MLYIYIYMYVHKTKALLLPGAFYRIENTPQVVAEWRWGGGGETGVPLQRALKRVPARCARQREPRFPLLGAGPWWKRWDAAGRCCVPAVVPPDTRRSVFVPTAGRLDGSEKTISCAAAYTSSLFTVLSIHSLMRRLSNFFFPSKKEFPRVRKPSRAEVAAG